MPNCEVLVQDRKVYPRLAGTASSSTRFLINLLMWAISHFFMASVTYREPGSISASVVVVPGLPSVNGTSLLMEARRVLEDHGYQVSIHLPMGTHYSIPLTEQITTLRKVLEAGQSLGRSTHLIGYSLGAIPALMTGSLSSGVMLWDPSASPHQVFKTVHYSEERHVYGFEDVELSIAPEVIDDLANIPDMDSIIQKCVALTSIVTAGKGGSRLGKEYFSKLPNPGTYVDIAGANHEFTGVDHRNELLAHTLRELLVRDC